MTEQFDTRLDKKYSPRLWFLCIAITVTLVGSIAVVNSLSQLVHSNKAIAEDVRPLPEPVPVGQQGRWTLIFQDEFNANVLDRTIWTDCYWWDWEDIGCTNKSNHELEWYTPENVFLNGGALKLQAQEQIIRDASSQRYTYTSGMVTTGPANLDEVDSPRFVFQHGYIEVRARMPRGQGLWPAIWLLPANLDSQLEIDIIEVLGHDPSTAQMHYHYLDEGGNYADVGESWVGPDFSKDWHIFALDWNPDYTAWIVGGVERWQTTSVYLPDEPMYLVMNLAVGGDWPGSPSADTPFPGTFEIDYIRVWERTSGE